jgi:hypothetical protein
VFEYWIPPVRRIPSLLWIRIRNEIGSYLVENGSDGVAAYSWYHRQFTESARKRYLFDPIVDAARRLALVDYFDCKWVSGKTYRDKNDMVHANEDRQISDQQTCLFGDRKSERVLNKRKLRELPYQLLRLRDWNRYVAVCCQLEFIEAKFEAEQGYDCFSLFEEAVRLSDDEVINAWFKFIRASFARLIVRPISVYQLASQQVNDLFADYLLSLLTVKCDTCIQQELTNPCEAC